MLNALRWLAKKLVARRLQPAYAWAIRGQSHGQSPWAIAGLIAAGAATLSSPLSAQQPESSMISRMDRFGGYSSSTGPQISDSQLKLMGLDAIWRAQMQMPVESGSIVSTHLWTDPNVRKAYAEITLPAGQGTGKRTFRVDAGTIGADGKPIGMEAAKHEAETRAARALGRMSGIPAVEVVVPKIYFIAVSSDGLVQTFDAETGELLWRNSAGPAHFPAAPACVSDAGVLVAQGPILYLLDLNTGKQIEKRKLERSTSSGVAMTGSVAFVSSLSGQTEIFNFAKPINPAKQVNNESIKYRLLGRTVAPPASSNRNSNLVAFSTDRSIVTLLSGGEKIGPWFNVRSRAPLSGPLTFVGGALYVSDATGQLSKVKLDRLGSVIWRAMMGEPLVSNPVVIEKVCYVTNEVGQLVALDDESGFPVWPQAIPRVKSILGGTKERLFCRSLTNRLLIIDTKTGRLLGESGSDVIGTGVINQLDDRLYFISSSGVLQCARQSGKDYLTPTFHEPLPSPTETDEPKPAEATPAMETPAAEESAVDPFGAASGDGMAPAEATADPFAVPATPAAGGNPF